MIDSVYDPVYEPEFAFLPHGCDACGARFLTAGDVALHQRETCERRFGSPERFVTPAEPRAFIFELPGSGGVHDGGRRM